MKKIIVLIIIFYSITNIVFGKILYFSEINKENINLNQYEDIEKLKTEIKDIINDNKDEYETEEEYKSRIIEKTNMLNQQEFIIECDNKYTYNANTQKFQFKLNFQNFQIITNRYPNENELIFPCDIKTAKQYKNKKIETVIVVKNILPEIIKKDDSNGEEIKLNNMEEIRENDYFYMEIRDSLKNKKIKFEMEKIIFYIGETKEEIAEIDDFEITENQNSMRIAKDLSGYVTEEGLVIVDEAGKRSNRIDGLEITSIPFVYKGYNKDTNKYFLKNTKGEILGDENNREFDDIIEIPLGANFDGIYSNKNILIVKQGNKYGIVDKNGKIILNIEYDGVYGMESDSGSGGSWNATDFLIEKDGKMGLVDENGKVKIEPKYEILNIKNYFIIENNNEVNNGNAENKRRYEFAKEEYKDSNILKIKLEEQYGMIMENEVYFPKDKSYNMVFDGNKNYMLVGNVVLGEENITNDIGEGEKNIVIKSAKCGVVKSNGDFLFKLGTFDIVKGELGIEINGAKLFGDMLQIVYQGKKNIYGKDGKIIYSNAEIIEGCIIKQNGKYGIIDLLTGGIIEPIKHVKIEECRAIIEKSWRMQEKNSEVSETKEEYNIFEKSGKYGIKNTRGKELVSPIFNSIEENRGAFIVTKNNKQGIVNQKNWEIVYYDSLKPAVFNLFFISKGNKIGVINNYGEYVLELSNFYEYKILAEKTIFVKDYSGYWFPVDKYGVNKTDGKYVEVNCEIKLNSAEDDMNNEGGNIENRVVVKGANYKYGILNTDGEELYACEADKIEREYIGIFGKAFLNEECRIPLFKIYKGVKYTYIDNNGKYLGETVNGVESFAEEYKLPTLISPQCLREDTVITYSYYPNLGKIKAGISNKKGEIIAAPVFDEIQFYPEYAVLATGNFIICVDYNETAYEYIREAAVTIEAGTETAAQ